ncbi:MAG: CDP-glycerol glycerophosphotransferase family protein [Microbacteriaceae bacterium]
MAGSAFARGNAKKLLFLPLYGLGYAASLLIPRQAGLWVFGSGPGIGEGALELYRYARSADPGSTLIWLTRDHRDVVRAESLGIRAVPKSSIRGFWVTLRAQVVVVTHGFGDVNRFAVHGAFIVQLWHGIPLKRIQLDSQVTTGLPIIARSAVIRRLLNRMYRQAYSTIGMMPAASEFSAVRLRSAFALPPERVVVTGDPRDDVLLRGTEEQRIAAARRRLREATAVESLGRRLLLYAPTWRDGAADPAMPTAGQWQRIDRYLRASDSTLLIRPHPLGAGDYAAGLQFSERILELRPDQENDITPVLPAMDLLITDYSSTAFDYALTGRPLLFLAVDRTEYSATRGLYQPYHQFTGGTETASWDELLELLENADSDPAVIAALRQHSAELSEAVHAYRDGRNAERVFAEIIRRLAARR